MSDGVRSSVVAVGTALDGAVVMGCTRTKKNSDTQRDDSCLVEIAVARL